MENILAHDLMMMDKALQLSLKARVIAPPNPWVGCLIVNQGKIVGEGYTQRPGEAHAEIMALHHAKNLTKGATVYVTLEPCAHYGRTPPCVNALIEAGVSRIVIGLEDPDTHVQGKGISMLKNAGIEVIKGILSSSISESLAPYLHHRRTGMPYCVLKSAVSIDGRIAAKDGSSKWISSPETRADSHQLRAESQAIIIGSRTACADEPFLTVRNVLQEPSSPPLRVILDSQGRTPAKGPLFDTSVAPTMVITSDHCPKKNRDIWESCGVQVEVVSMSQKNLGLNLLEVLNLLGKRGILQVMVEGGGIVLGSFLESGFANKIIIYIGSCILGSSGTPLFSTNFITTLKESPKLTLLKAKTLGNSMRLDYTLK